MNNKELNEQIKVTETERRFYKKFKSRGGF